jgi:hypothetical protein
MVNYAGLVKCLVENPTPVTDNDPVTSVESNACKLGLYYISYFRPFRR